jgi:hypothetical protein
LVRRKFPLTHWFLLEVHVIGTERRAEVRPICSISLTIGAMEGTSGQLQVRLSLLPTDHTAYGNLKGKLLKIILTYELKMSTIVLVFAIISSEAK